MRRDIIKKLSVILSATLVALFVVPADTAYSKTITREKYMYDNTIETLVIDDDVTSIGDRAYYGCKNLTSVTIPEGVKTIGESAFAMCPKLSYVSIPSTVKTIEPGVFSGDTSLSALTFPNGNTNFIFLGGALYNAKGTKLISYLPGKEYHFYDMPDTIKDVDKYAFWGSKNLEKVYVSPNVTSITPYDFAYCSDLKYIFLPSSVESIQEYAFRDCINLEAVYAENKKLKIDPTAFKRAAKAKTVSGTNLETFNSKCVIEGEDEEAASMIEEATNHRADNKTPVQGSGSGSSVSAQRNGMTEEEWGRYVARNSHFTSNDYKSRVAVTDSINPTTGSGNASSSSTGSGSASSSSTGSGSASSSSTGSGNASSSSTGSGSASSSSTGSGSASSSSIGSGSASSSSTGSGNASSSSTGSGSASSNSAAPTAAPTQAPGHVTIINENYYF